MPALAAAAKDNLFGKTLSELDPIVEQAGLRPFAARQLARWLYGRNAERFEDMTNLPAGARRWLAERFEVRLQAPTAEAQSADGTRKYLFPAAGRFVEAAFIPEGRRATLCLSVQVGCKMGCLFCQTGRQGFQGNLSAGEILNQVASLPERERLTNLVYMGMGEPLDNLDNVLASLEILTSDWGYALSPARITVSTVGLLPAMLRFLSASRCHLAVSLHSPFEEERRRLMPVQNVYPLREVLEALRGALREHLAAGRRRVSFEYILFDGLNDTPRHARELARILRGIRGRINLIPFHPIPGSPLAPSGPERIQAFQELLKASGFITTLRKSRGLDIAAACGLLSTKKLLERERAKEPQEF
jgi:23S rRNA (adenine2503-C2)-methyltransferase